jgi:hypothetical protein
MAFSPLRGEAPEPGDCAQAMHKTTRANTNTSEARINLPPFVIRQYNDQKPAGHPHFHFSEKTSVADISYSKRSLPRTV